MPETILERLARPGILVADGATGTMLQQAGLTRGVAPGESGAPAYRSQQRLPPLVDFAIPDLQPPILKGGPYGIPIW